MEKLPSPGPTFVEKPIVLCNITIALPCQLREMSQKLPAGLGLRMLLRTILLMFPLLLTGCADQLPSVKPLARFSDLVRGYDKTMTKEERQAAIEELKEVQARAQQQGGTKPEPAAKAQQSGKQAAAKAAQKQD